MEKSIGWFTAERLYAIGTGALRVLLILLIAYIAVKLVRRALARIAAAMLNRMERRRGQSGEELEKRAQTLSGILAATSVVAIWIAAVIMALKEVGFNVGPLLAGAGVVGLAVGFGAQSLVKDVISGALMLLENQVRVGDVALINGTGGLVERIINLRTTVLRGLDGTVHIFANGKINTVSNMTHDYSYYVFDIGVAYKEDTDHVIRVLEQVAEELRQEEEYGSQILEPLDVLGVDKFGDSAVVVKVRIKTKPIKQWMVGREMIRRIKKRFDELGIEIPFPHRSIYFGEASKPISISAAGNGHFDPRRAEELTRRDDAVHAGAST